MTAPRVCVLDDVDDVAQGLSALDRLQELADVVVLGDLDEDALVEAAREAVVVIPIRERRAITAELISRLPRLEHVAQTGGGAAHIDRSALDARGITLSLTPGQSASAVAELILWHIISAERCTLDAAEALRAGGWWRPLGREISSLTVGALGGGATGSAVLRRVSALGGRPLLSSRRAGAGAALGVEQVEQEELFARADVVSVHVELSERTHHLVGAHELRALGPNGGLVNTARAGIVDQGALLTALNQGELGWAALDVFVDEPPRDDALVGHPRVVATPHLGWRTYETLRRFLEGAIENSIAYLQQRSHSHERLHDE